MWRLRAISYFHVAAACACTAFVLVDTGLIPQMPPSPAILRLLFRAFLIPAMLTWIACPLATLLVIARRRPPANIALSGVVVEFSLSAFQLVALLPLVI